jgi:FKBP-type peptidyl-prolyl cis-trans isomerase
MTKEVDKFMLFLWLLLLQQKYHLVLVDCMLVQNQKNRCTCFRNKCSFKETKLVPRQRIPLFASDSQRQKYDLRENERYDNENEQSISSVTSRRTLLQCLSGATTATTIISLAGNIVTTSPVNAADSLASLTVEDESSLTVVKTPSGLKYIDLMPGTGITPQYGNLCSIQYNAYIKLAKTPDNPDPQPQLYDKVTDGYLIKHGNGRMIPGLDEGLHTMKVGGYRRIIIPPKLGYIDNGLGPIPEYPWQRYKLNSLLDQMISIGAGTIIFEVKLLSVINDEADQGYYLDDSLSPEDFNTLRENLRIKGLQQRQKQQIP